VISAQRISEIVKMEELREFSGIEGKRQKFREMTGERIGGEPEFNNFLVIHYPARMFFYKDERVIYQVREMSDSPCATIAVPGYVKSKPYMKEGQENINFGDKYGDEKIVKEDSSLTVKVEPVGKRDRKELEGLVRKFSKKDCKPEKTYQIEFWS
jgi:hypothetical protein